MYCVFDLFVNSVCIMIVINYEKKKLENEQKNCQECGVNLTVQYRLSAARSVQKRPRVSILPVKS